MSIESNWSHRIHVIYTSNFCCKHRYCKTMFYSTVFASSCFIIRCKIYLNVRVLGFVVIVKVVIVIAVAMVIMTMMMTMMIIMFTKSCYQHKFTFQLGYGRKLIMILIVVFLFPSISGMWCTVRGICNGAIESCNYSKLPLARKSTKLDLLFL